jgi:Transcriptional regulator, AbiEi antitoxin/Protein of unknown function (DUF559)
VDTPHGLARLAARQHGVLTHTQLLDGGIGERAIRYRVRTGRLHRVHRGVYAVGYISLSPFALAMAGVLACGPGAVLSHRSAGVLWEIIGSDHRRPIDLTVPGHSRPRGLNVHRSRTLDPSHVTTHRGIPVTRVVRTLIDLADVLDDLALARAVNEAQIKRLMRLDELSNLLAGTHGRRGAIRLRPFLEREGPTRSVFEDRFLVFVDRHGLPRPEVNQRVGGYEVDMLWRPQRFVVELDGRSFHERPHAFERDRVKDANLLAAGYAVIRITWRRLNDEPEREAARLRRILATATGTRAARAPARRRPDLDEILRRR